MDILCDEEKFQRTSQELSILEEIKNNINKINGIIKRVLNFARQSDSNMIHVDVGTLIRDTVDLWGSRMRKDKIELSLSLERDLVGILGDPIEIQQVLNNLLQNAIEAMKEGGPLSVAARSGVFSFDKTRSAVIITIRDSGPGIPPEQQKSIFNPFFTTKPTGTGLGLAISHRIVGRHGGIIHFDSIAGEGTTFTIELPDGPGA